MQLPSQPDPKSLWPSVGWKDVTSDYAGLFFRAEGGGSLPFGSLQESSSNKILIQHNNTTSPIGYISDGVISALSGTPSTTYSLFSKNEEIRPRNKAVRIWKRSS